MEALTGFFFLSRQYFLVSPLIIPRNLIFVKRWRRAALSFLQLPQPLAPSCPSSCVSIRSGKGFIIVDKRVKCGKVCEKNHNICEINHKLRGSCEINHKACEINHKGRIKEEIMQFLCRKGAISVYFCYI